jgi:hypothetical protein
LSFTTNTGCTVTAGANDPTKVVQDCTDSDPT